MHGLSLILTIPNDLLSGCLLGGILALYVLPCSHYRALLVAADNHIVHYKGHLGALLTELRFICGILGLGPFFGCGGP